METQQSNAQASQGGDLAQIKQMFANYRSKSAGKGNTDNDSNELKGDKLLAKFFTPREEKEYFRLLPPKNPQVPYDTAFFHPVKINGQNGKKSWSKVYCPRHNDPKVPKKDKNGEVVLNSDGKPLMIPAPCPLCAKAAKIKSKQDFESLKGVKPENYNKKQKEIAAKNKEIWKDSTQWEAKKFYIFRGIDRGKTGDGVKFWRFKHNFKKQGVMDKLLPVLDNYIEQNQVAYYDTKKGCDLIISTSEDTIPGTNKTYTVVSNIMPKNPSALSDDGIIIKSWVNDPITWRDVFKPKTAPHMDKETFLERITVGTNPYWDQSDEDDKKWVFPDERDEELQVKANTRDESLGSNTREENIEMASDVVAGSYNNVNIENVTSEDVGEDTDDSVDATEGLMEYDDVDVNVEDDIDEDEESNDSMDIEDDDSDYDDLPF